MGIPVKATAVGTILVGVGGTGIYLTYHRGMPEWHSISKNSDAAKTYGSDKYANAYVKYLVDADDSKNDAWWNWSYGKQYSSATEGFKSEIKDGKTLKETCKKAYLASSNVDSTTKSVTNDNAKYVEEEIWRFCSIGIEMPKTLGDEKVKEEKDKITTGDWKDKIGGQNKGVLLSIDHPENEWIWGLKQLEFEGEENKTETNKFFSKPAAGTTVSIKQKCKEAYGKDNSATSGDANTPTKDETIKWCSLKGQTTTTPAA